MSKHLIFDLDKLHDRCDEVNPIDAQQTVKEITLKLNKYKDLYALSAPQLGIKERVLCIKYNNGVIKEYINPVILKASKYHYIREHDITIPEKEFIALRPTEILVRYQTNTAKPEENIVKDSAAEIFDRMVNYLDGLTLEDVALPIDEEWKFDELTEEDQKELVDKDAKELKDAIDFMTAVDEGKVTLDYSYKKK